LQLSAMEKGENAPIVRRKTWLRLDIAQALKDLETASLEVVAKQIGVSRNSLRFAINRAGIDLRAYRSFKARERDKRRFPKSASQSFLAPNEAKPFVAMEAIEAKPDNGCSWPIGDLESGEFSFCGQPRLFKKAYCAACMGKAYVG
jgi:hypothetical protein